MNTPTGAVSVDLQTGDSQVDVFTFNDQPSRVIRTLSGDHVNPEGAFVTIRVLSSSRCSESIEVHAVPFEDKKLIRRERIVLPVTRSECGNYFEVESEDLDIFLWEESVDELKDAFEAVLRIMWRRYVMGDYRKMTQSELEFREHLKNIYRCV